jgi:hypothetical protein
MIKRVDVPVKVNMMSVSGRLGEARREQEEREAAAARAGSADEDEDEVVEEDHGFPVTAPRTDAPVFDDDDEEEEHDGKKEEKDPSVRRHLGEFAESPVMATPETHETERHRAYVRLSPSLPLCRPSTRLTLCTFAESKSTNPRNRIEPFVVDEAATRPLLLIAPPAPASLEYGHLVRNLSQLSFTPLLTLFFPPQTTATSTRFPKAPPISLPPLPLSRALISTSPVVTSTWDERARSSFATRWSIPTSVSAVNVPSPRTPTFQHLVESLTPTFATSRAAPLLERELTRSSRARCTPVSEDSLIPSLRRRRWRGSAFRR